MFAVHFLSSRVMMGPLAAGRSDPPVKPGWRGLHESYLSRPRHTAVPTPSISIVWVHSRTTGSRTASNITPSASCCCACTQPNSPRRLNPGDTVEVAVHAMCPGGVASNIARDTPALLRPVVNPLLRLLLQTPEEAVRRPSTCAAPRRQAAPTGMYLHLMQRKSVLPAASDPQNGARLWEASAKLVSASREFL